MSTPEENEVATTAVATSAERSSRARHQLRAAATTAALSAQLRAGVRRRPLPAVAAAGAAGWMVARAIAKDAPGATMASSLVVSPLLRAVLAQVIRVARTAV